ncbi:hypothetical protein B0H14DRAFT_3439282 [Mycena olivaceomarginata]|nr:hypothetical protein B0H14DRAFT_3439282 [Mycena olivaceomarginata]
MSQVDEFWYRLLSKSFVKEYWYNLRIFLETAEYRLRPKFQPDFVIPPRRNDCRADTYRRRAIMDAVRMPDGKIVMLKAISKERFLFELEIGHDCTYLNIVVDPTELLPHGFHPVITHYTPDMNEFMHAIRRTECWPRYCLIDFGISSI